MTYGKLAESLAARMHIILFDNHDQGPLDADLMKRVAEFICDMSPQSNPIFTL